MQKKDIVTALGVWAGAWGVFYLLSIWLISPLYGLLTSLLPAAGAANGPQWLSVLFLPAAAFAVLLAVKRLWRGFQIWMVGMFLLFELIRNLLDALLRPLVYAFYNPVGEGAHKSLLEIMDPTFALLTASAFVASTAIGYGLALLVSKWMDRSQSEKIAGESAGEDSKAWQRTALRILEAWFPLIASLTFIAIVAPLLGYMLEVAALSAGVTWSKVTSVSSLDGAILNWPRAIDVAGRVLVAIGVGIAYRTRFGMVRLWPVLLLVFLALAPHILLEGKLTLPMLIERGRTSLSDVVVSYLAPVVLPALMGGLTFWFMTNVKRLRGRA